MTGLQYLCVSRFSREINATRKFGSVVSLLSFDDTSSSKVHSIEGTEVHQK